jgi:hypothetical protein
METTGFIHTKTLHRTSHELLGHLKRLRRKPLTPSVPHDAQGSLQAFANHCGLADG